MINPAITVLLPTNRLDGYFNLALKSVSADLTEDSEVLVVLNGEAIEQARGFDWASFHIANLRLLNSYERGLVPALNLGLSEARGEFIARMDADDETLPGRFAKQLAFLRKRPDFAAVGTQIVEVCPHGKFGAKSYLPKRISRRPWPPLNTKIAHPSVMFRREMVLLIGGYRANFVHAEDQDLWLRLLKVSKVGNLKEVFLKYRKHSNQISAANADEQQLGVIQTYLSNARLDTGDIALFEAKNAKDFRHLIWGSNRLSLKEKVLLHFIINYWAFGVSIQGRFARLVSRGCRHPLMSLVFVWANRRAMFKLTRGRHICADCDQ